MDNFKNPVSGSNLNNPSKIEKHKLNSPIVNNKGQEKYKSFRRKLRKDMFR